MDFCEHYKSALRKGGISLNIEQQKRLANILYLEGVLSQVHKQMSLRRYDTDAEHDFRTVKRQLRNLYGGFSHPSMVLRDMVNRSKKSDN